jgi:phosphatidylethanolamine N-methyltransferase
MLKRAFANANWQWVAIAGASLVASPLIWNIVARNEYKNKTMTRLFGSATNGCYALAAWIFFSSLARDKLVDIAIEKSKPASIPYLEDVPLKTMQLAGKALIGVGVGLATLSMYRLGITGTYLGDYFGILMDEPVTAFPFNAKWLPDPMYTGASIGFLGLAVHENSPVGVLLAVFAWSVYKVSTTFYEDPFTAKVYAEKAEREKRAKQEENQQPQEKPKDA